MRLFALGKCLCGIEPCVILQKFVIDALCTAAVAAAKPSFAVRAFAEYSIFSVQAGVAAKNLRVQGFHTEKQTFYGIPWLLVVPLGCL